MNTSIYQSQLAFFLINSKAAQFIITSKNQIWTKKISPIIVRYLIFPSYLNIQKELSNYVSLSQTSNIILLKLLFFLFMTTLSRLWVYNRSLFSLFSTCLLLLGQVSIPCLPRRALVAPSEEISGLSDEGPGMGINVPRDAGA